MNKKITEGRWVLPILFLAILTACNEEPEPEPVEYSAYCSLYHFIEAGNDIEWEVDGVPVDWQQSYGTVVSGFVVLEEPSEDISFVLRNSDNGDVIDSLQFNLTENTNYLLTVFGAGGAMESVFQKVPETPPSGGNLNIQFLHTASEFDSLDIYAGGDEPEDRIVTGLAYSGLSGYLELDETSAQISITVTSSGGPADPDSAYLYYAYNDALVRGRNYLSVIAPASPQPGAGLKLWLYTQPFNF